MSGQTGQTGQKFTLVMDSSQIQLFLTCPLKWYYTYVKRLVPVSYDATEEEKAMNMGTYGHKLLDIFYRSKMEGLSLKDTIERCWAYNPDKDLCECGCPHELHKSLLADGLDGEIQECQRCTHCIKYRPHPFPLAVDVRSTVFNRFKDYVYKWQGNDFLPDSSQHVEVGFSEPIYEDCENYYVLEGRMDLLGSLQGVPCVVDHKFQLSTHYLYPKTLQFKNYAMVSGLGTLVINYVRLTKTMNQDTLARDLTTFSREELRIWKERLIAIYHQMRSVIQGGTYEQRWDACQGDYKTYDKNKPRWCWFSQLCEEPSQVLRERKQDLLYKVKESTWRPW